MDLDRVRDRLIFVCDQYNSILREYDTKQYNAKHLLDIRTKEIEEAIPEFKKLNQDIVSKSIRCAKKALFNEFIDISLY